MNTQINNLETSETLVHMAHVLGDFDTSLTLFTVFIKAVFLKNEEHIYKYLIMIIIYYYIP